MNPVPRKARGDRSPGPQYEPYGSLAPIARVRQDQLLKSYLSICSSVLDFETRALKRPDKFLPKALAQRIDSNPEPAGHPVNRGVGLDENKSARRELRSRTA